MCEYDDDGGGSGILSVLRRRRLWRLFAALAGGVLGEGTSAEGSAPPGSAAVWFEDLAHAKPLAAAAREELARHLTELGLAAGERSAELSPSLAGDREPRMIFLSLGDGETRARVLRAAARGVAAATERLRDELRALAADGFEPRAVRVDLVTEVRRQRARSDQALALDRSLFGLAFERQVGLAFLADEVVTYTLIDSDQQLRWRNVAKRPEAAAARPRLDRLRESAGAPVFRFATASYFSDGSAPVALYRGHRSFADLAPEQLLRHAELGGRYLVSSLASDGRFVYSYLPKTGEVKKKYNALRHCGTVYAMLELYEVTGDRELLAAAERALGYLERELLRRCRVGAAETACVVERGWVKLGGNALAMLALAKHAAVTGDKRHLGTIDDLGRWILLSQGEDGEFEIHKQSYPGGEVSEFVSDYYPGEALLALVRRPEPDAAWLDAAERGARWLIEVRDRGLPAAALKHDHWLLYALRELHRLRPDPSYLEHASRIAAAILDRQRQEKPEFPDWLGSYYRPPRSTPTATRSEGLGAAYLMLRDGGRAKRAAALLDGLELGVGFQLQTQFLPETVLFLDDPARALGGFRRSLTNYEIRIDYVQHNISSLLLLRRILLADAAGAAGRSETANRP